MSKAFITITHEDEHVATTLARIVEVALADMKFRHVTQLAPKARDRSVGLYTVESNKIKETIGQQVAVNVLVAGVKPPVGRP